MFSRVPRLVFRLLILVCFWPLLASAQTRLHLTIPDPRVSEPVATAPFYEAALRLALSKTAPEGEQLSISYVNASIGRERMRALLAAGNMDVMWSSNTPLREAQLLPIKFNLLKGINEYRYLLVRSGDQGKFAQISTLQDLRNLRVGAGTHWSDSQIFRLNGFNVVNSWSTNSLFRMLAAGRFDFLARPYDEMLNDLREHTDLKLQQVPDLIIHYAQPVYFFVSNSNPALAARIQKGLELALQDGSFDQLFFSVAEFKNAWDHIQQHGNTRIIYLQALEPNPNEPPSI